MSENNKTKTKGHGFQNVRVLIEVKEIQGVGWCKNVRVGQKWVYPDDLNGICPSALNSMLPHLWSLRFGATHPQYNISNSKDTVYLCCSDATKPVVYSCTRFENAESVKHHVGQSRIDTLESP